MVTTAPFPGPVCATHGRPMAGRGVRAVRAEAVRTGRADGGDATVPGERARSGRQAGLRPFGCEKAVFACEGSVCPEAMATSFSETA